MLISLFLSFLLIGGGGVTDDILGRLERLERDNASLRGQVSALSVDTVRTNRSRRDAMSSADMNALLAPRSLGNPIGARGGRDTTPDLGSPLLSRLRDDQSMPGTSGRVDTYGGYANMLWDPVFDTIPEDAVTVGAAYTDLGPDWEAIYVVNSGTGPTTRTVQGLQRIGNAATSGSSAVAVVTMDFGVNASDTTLTIRQAFSTALQPALGPIPSWLVGSVLAWPYEATGFTSVSITAEIEDGAGTAYASGESVDVLGLLDIDERGQAEVGYDAPAVSTGYYLRFTINAVKDAGAVAALDLFLSEPLMAFSDDGSVPAFTPAIGLWHPPQLTTLDFVQLNIPAGTTANMPVSENGAPAQIPIPWDGSIVGMSYRMDGTLSAGTLAIKAKINGTAVWTAHSLTSASAADGVADQGPGKDQFVTGDVIAVELVSNAGFLPTTRDIVVVLWLRVNYRE